jgi:hypothetical protein
MVGVHPAQPAAMLLLGGPQGHPSSLAQAPARPAGACSDGKAGRGGCDTYCVEAAVGEDGDGAAVLYDAVEVRQRVLQPRRVGRAHRHRYDTRKQAAPHRLHKLQSCAQTRGFIRRTPAAGNPCRPSVSAAKHVMLPTTTSSMLVTGVSHGCSTWRVHQHNSVAMPEAAGPQKILRHRPCGVVGAVAGDHVRDIAVVIQVPIDWPVWVGVHIAAQRVHNPVSARGLGSRSTCRMPPYFVPL